jgi:solute carrier family 29 (equilibrative nucleoside transporter), member 1/2/3
LQSVMAGQAAVGVLVSAVQLASTAGSLRIAPAPPPTPPDSVETAVLFMRRTMSEVNMRSRDAEARAAGWFFGLSTVFLLSTIGAHWWLLRLPAYRAVMDEHTHERAPPSPIMESHHPHRDERHALMDAGISGDEKARIKRVAKANMVLEFTVAFVFTVTLVSTKTSA